MLPLFFFFPKSHLAVEEQSLPCTCHKSAPTYFGKLKHWMKKGRPERLRIFCSLDCTERSQEWRLDQLVTGCVHTSPDIQQQGLRVSVCRSEDRWLLFLGSTVGAHVTYLCFWRPGHTPLGHGKRAEVSPVNREEQEIEKEWKSGPKEASNALTYL